MQIIINAPDDIPAAVIEQQVKEFENQLKKLHHQLQPQKEEVNTSVDRSNNENKLSKWALLVQEIETGNYFNDYSEQIKRDAKEVREGFVFASDK